MSATHHPSDALILAYGAGTLDEAAALLVASHMALCQRCRTVAEEVDAIGGALLEGLAPTSLAEGALEATLAQLDAMPAEARPTVRQSVLSDPTLADIPMPLRGYLAGGLDGLTWWPLRPGLRQAKLLSVAGGSTARLFPHRAGGGGSAARPRRQRVYPGAARCLCRRARPFRSRAMSARPTRRSCTDAVAECDGPCLSLIVTDAPIRPTGLVGRLLQLFLPV